SRHAGGTGLRGIPRRAAGIAAARRAGAAGRRRHGVAAARRAGRPARARGKPPRGRAARRTAVDHGLPRRRTCQPQAQPSGNECPAARDGSHRTLRTMQSWPSDLGPLRPGRDRPMVPARTLTMPKPIILLALSTLVVTLVACQKGDGTAAPDPDAEAAAAAFAKAEQSWRDQRLQRLLAPDGWTSLVGLHWIEPGGHYLGSDADN